MEDCKDQKVVEHLRDAISKDPDHAADWQFFLDSKGRSQSDADLVRSCVFAVKFVEKWQDARITLQVSYTYLPESFTIKHF